jgi:hypothetical protein
MAEPVFDRKDYLEQELRKVVGDFVPKEPLRARVRRWLLIALAAEATAVALWLLLASESSPFARPNAPKAPPKKPVSVQLLPPRAE